MHLDPDKLMYKILEMSAEHLITMNAYILYMTLFSVLDKLHYPQKFQISNKELAKDARIGTSAGKGRKSREAMQDSWQYKDSRARLHRQGGEPCFVFFLG